LLLLLPPLLSGAREAGTTLKVEREAGVERECLMI
jgi:hypothetical protein